MIATLPLSPTDAPLRRLAWAVLALGSLAMLAVAVVTLLARAPRRESAATVAGVGAVAAPRSVSRPPAPAPIRRAPMVGSTGTTDLPALPAAIAAGLAQGPVDTGVVAAAPFRFAAAGGVDRGRALQCLTAAIYYEAASEPHAGQQAVAQVVLNRVRHPAFPGTVCGVVYQGSQGPGCQFSFACDGAMARHRPSPGGWARAARVAALALVGRVYAPVGLATHYHTYAVTPAWNRSLVMTGAVGAHLFHRWKGWWGTASAFSRRYAGGEPEPGPHPSPLLSAPVPVPLVAPVSPTPVTPVTPLAAIQPTYRASGAAVAMPVDDRLPPAATILPRWRDSGRPLR